MMVRLASMIGISALALALAGCGGDKQPEPTAAADKFEGGGGINLARLIGTTKNAPDEFAIIPSAPLQLPEDFASLPTPTPGARSPLTPDPIAKAQSLLLGDAAPQPANARLSVSESALVSATGPVPEANIREVLATEQAQIDEERPVYLLQRVFPSLQRSADRIEAITPEEERLRLREIAASQAGSGNGIAEIPASPPTQPAAIPPTETATGGELIYITE